MTTETQIRCERCHKPLPDGADPKMWRYFHSWFGEHFWCDDCASAAKADYRKYWQPRD